MKNKISKILCMTVLGSALMFGPGMIKNFENPEVVYANQTTAGQTNLLQVNGQGSIKVKPDVAQLQLGVQIQNKDAKTAQQQNAAKMDEVVKALKALGIAEKDIQTSNYSIYPQYKYDEKTGESLITGYTVNNSVHVTVRDITKVGNVIDTAADKGANTSYGISFTVSNPEQYYNQALKKAVENAKGKAAAIAEAIDVKLGKPNAVTEQGYQGVTVQYTARKEAMDMAGAATPVEAGELEITANVSVSYSY